MFDQGTFNKLITFCLKNIEKTFWWVLVVKGTV